MYLRKLAFPPQKEKAAPSGWPGAAVCIEEGGTPRQYGQRNAPAADTPPHLKENKQQRPAEFIIQEGGANVKRGIGGGDPGRGTGAHG